MKKIMILFSWLFLLGCTEESRLFVKTDTVAPNTVSNVLVRNIPGGAVLKYDLPEDEDLLYVKAVYSLKEGIESEARASYFVDSLVVEGFGTEDPRTVQLIAVDNSENESEPVIVEIKPLEAPVVTISNSLSLIADFGGVTASWKNETKTPVSIVVEIKDEYGDYIPLDVYYSSSEDGTASTRGMEAVSRDFRAFVQDKWGNTSMPLEVNLVPLFEEKFTMSKFGALSLEGDQGPGWGWVLTNLWDGNINSGFHTEPGTGVWPHTFSIDMGQTGKISRVKLWQRTEGDYVYKHGNIKRFELYGTNDGTNLNDWSTWTKLFEGVSRKPSGLPLGQYSEEDLTYAKAGEEFLCPPDMPAVRYLRFKVTENWSESDFLHVMEIEVYGQLEKE